MVHLDDAQATFTQILTGNATFDALVGAQLPPDQGVGTVLHFPAMWSLGTAFEPSPAWTVEADFIYFEWSVFKDLPIRFHRTPCRNTDRIEDYQDSWQIRTGAEHRRGDLDLSRRLLLRQVPGADGRRHAAAAGRRPSRREPRPGLVARGRPALERWTSTSWACS